MGLEVTCKKRKVDNALSTEQKNENDIVKLPRNRLIDRVGTKSMVSLPTPSLLLASLYRLIAECSIDLSQDLTNQRYPQELFLMMLVLH